MLQTPLLCCVCICGVAGATTAVYVGIRGVADATTVLCMRAVTDAELAGRPAAHDEESGELSCADRAAATVLSLYFDVAPQSLDGAHRLALLHSVAGEPQPLFRFLTYFFFIGSQ